MTYSEALEYITDALKFGINPGLEKIEAVCKLLGDPQFNYPTIQVTGTNGKTSTTWMARRILSSSGLKTGCYTSPHLHSYRERITVDGAMISEQDFADTLETIRPALDEAKGRFGDLTEFEILTAMAVHYFHTAGVEVALFEVGLGGRWDATTVVRPKVAAITGISLDHTDRLGNTVEAIAWDKAHIIKKGSTAVIGNVTADAFAEIEKRCRDVEADTILFGRDYGCREIEIIKNEGSRFMIDGLYGEYNGIALPAYGVYQVYNFTMAVALCEAFCGDIISRDAIQSALNGLVCPGRFELVHKQPLVVLDGAHNPEGMRMVAEGLPKAFSYNKLHVVLAISNDKDIEQMLDILRSEAATLILSCNTSYRSASVERLADIAISLGNSYSIEPDLKKAVDLAMSFAGVDDLVCVTGSLYTVADARDILGGA